MKLAEADETLSSSANTVCCENNSVVSIPWLDRLLEILTHNIQGGLISIGCLPIIL